MEKLEQTPQNPKKLGRSTSKDLTKSKTTQITPIKISAENIMDTDTSITIPQDFPKNVETREQLQTPDVRRSMINSMLSGYVDNDR